MPHYTFDLRSGETVFINGAPVTLIHKSGRSAARLAVDVSGGAVVARGGSAPNNSTQEKPPDRRD